MSEFVDCRTCKTNCVRNDGNYGYTFCDKCTPTPMTNADRILSMSDEELANFVHEGCPYIDEECTMKGCVKCILEWLQKPAEKPEDDAT